jgi:hypothetical protein
LKRLLFLFGVLLTPLFSVDNHFIGMIASSGKLEGDSENILADETFSTFGIKSGILNEDMIAYIDIQHFNFDKNEVSVGQNQIPTKFNEDTLSLAIGPVFKMEKFYDTLFYVNGVGTIDKFHYGKEIVANHYTEYLSQYQFFFGYEFGLIFPARLNPLHDTDDSFFEIGYRKIYRNDSAMDDTNSESGFSEEEVIPFQSISSYYFGLNILF